MTDVVIVGAGVVGLATAWRCAQRGLATVLVDPRPAGGATRVSAGMLTPTTEAAYGEEELVRFALRSRGLYPAFAAELAEASGADPGYRAEGTLQVAFDSDDWAQLRELLAFTERLGVRTERLTSRETRRLEPMLSPAVRGALYAPDDHSVDPRRLAAALLRAAERAGARLLRRRAERLLLTADGAAAAGVLLDDGTELRARQVVLAAGADCGELAGLPRGAVPTIRPVKGQILRLRAPAGFLTRTVRGLVRGTPVYLVPRDGGELVLGATQEELGRDERLTVGGVWQLLRDARELVPGVAELEITETAVGLRPGAADNLPLLGPTALPGLQLAAGHFRHGVLLAPVTAEVMAHAVAEEKLPDHAREFAATRTAGTAARTKG
ncbi:glycine oxidase ThiO [Allonocardiopsis opalescens]|uniref:glycine oxidase n=1 Tax=Allonocardiopsis opalescens TaxID=1144618 RepID=A0A2T0PZQ0_9ACTN|nr:glycine oxidase ThiO [Allonocardiopsis opalescens]PRX97007.1 glycine oxidase [Allonocardiopsis opalescens]